MFDVVCCQLNQYEDSSLEKLWFAFTTVNPLLVINTLEPVFSTLVETDARKSSVVVCARPQVAGAPW